MRIGQTKLFTRPIHEKEKQMKRVRESKTEGKKVCETVRERGEERESHRHWCHQSVTTEHRAVPRFS